MGLNGEAAFDHQTVPTTHRSHCSATQQIHKIRFGPLQGRVVALLGLSRSILYLLIQIQIVSLYTKCLQHGVVGRLDRTE